MLYVDLEKKGKHCLISEMHRCQVPSVYRRRSMFASGRSHLHQSTSYSKGVSPSHLYRGADKSLARPTSRCILFGGENISFDASLIYIYIHTLYIYIYTGCPGRNVPDFERMFLKLKYTDITQNTYIQS